ncbi:glutathione S-transferase [Mesorhizobium sp.]|uniref:glutathione S-transferase n=1 Tax=Mesorhizobium sp. TaxID=1871066 RepID=UPI000FE90B91|nr:glutathione S-transferase [Mesorhizobium sp.]RWK65583.1 MAG: glutathione S-transferase [Mesorhizobium sp.]RWM53801.1 MAG: glutathione S-transferase [Mesorhizobium sp.]RWM54615.1 MAG: glutathione S-transferase [Mesorhizobium sp.]RWM60831.1 MAG: glutathione S-transferase [Mesorhizobium sp.]RWM95174.1 MAG: glutathione S-transferase [Mesorhizobium sp.]
MKLFDGGRAPNPRRVRVFLAEKGLEVPLVPVDMGALEHRRQPVSSRNPLQRLPVLELDDGTVITESVAICRYFEELNPEPALFGRGALGKALVEMWQRRMELNLLSCVTAAFRHIHPAMKEWEIPQIPEWGEANKPKAVGFLKLLDGELANREFVAGDAYSIADITGLIAIDFMKPARIKVPEDCANVLRWHQAISSRPSAAA